MPPRAQVQEPPQVFSHKGAGDRMTGRGTAATLSLSLNTPAPNSVLTRNAGDHSGRARMRPARQGRSSSIFFPFFAANHVLGGKVLSSVVVFRRSRPIASTVAVGSGRPWESSRVSTTRAGGGAAAPLNAGASERGGDAPSAGTCRNGIGLFRPSGNAPATGPRKNAGRRRGPRMTAATAPSLNDPRRHQHPPLPRCCQS